MNSTQLEHADLLDIIFDNRNKEYGAYQLRRSYSKRITKAMVFTGLLVCALISVAFIPTNAETADALTKSDDSIVVKTYIIPEEIPQPVIPAQQVQRSAAPVKAIDFTTIIVVPDNTQTDPVTPVADMQNAQIALTKGDGENHVNTPSEPVGPPSPGIIETMPPKDEPPLREVDEHAKFQGDWVKFLRRNLRSEVPVDNDAPEGRYTVLVEFVVDADGAVSNVNALTQHGFGLEQEAIRVIRKSDKWIPSFWKGRPVKAYHRQQITFEVVNE